MHAATACIARIARPFHAISTMRFSGRSCIAQECANDQTAVASVVAQSPGGFGTRLIIVFFASVASGKLPAQVCDALLKAFCSTTM
jgi:hypothetical protein